MHRAEINRVAGDPETPPCKPRGMTRVPATLPPFLVLYASLFAAFGVASPFFAAFLGSRGLQPEAIGLVLGAGTAVRLLAGPVGGRIADRFGRPRLVLVLYIAAASLVAFGYLPANTFWLLLLIALVHASLLAPLTPIADALTLAASTLGGGFQYGWVRGIGSATFILGTLLSGQAVGRFGLVAIIWLNGMLFAVAACAARLVPEAPRLSAPVRKRRPAASRRCCGCRRSAA